MKIPSTPFSRNRGKLLALPAMLSSMLAVAGCSYNSNGDIVFDPPHCTIVSRSALKYDTPGTWSTISFTVRNDGEGSTAHNICISVKSKQNGVIVDEGTAIIASLEQGESIMKDVWLTKTNSTTGSSDISVKLTWHDDKGGYYE